MTIRNSVAGWIFILVAISILSFVEVQAQTAEKSSGTKTKQNGKVNLDELIGSMTLEEKIGQLSLFTSDWDVTGPTLNTNYKKYIREGKVGAIFNAYTVDYVRELQRMAVEESRLKIPLIFGYDVIHGHRTIFPIPLGQAATWNMEAISRSEQIAALEATAEGLNWTFAPMVDISRDPRWGRVAEGAGEDTWLVSKIAEARVRGFQGTDLKSGKSLLACVKHFAAYGAPQAGRDYHTVDMSALSLYEWYLPPYKAAIDAGVGSVMTSFNEINGVPSTCNPWLLTDLLRHNWGFRGFIVSDYTSVNELVPHGIAATEKEAAMLSLNAGLDMDMQGSTFLLSLGNLVSEKKVDETRINAAVKVILEAKENLGLFDDPYRYCNKEREQNEIMTAEHLAFARHMVAESCVLLKNDNQTLPIPINVKKIVVIGPLGDSRKDMLGNWSAAGNWEKCVTLVEGLKEKYKGKADVSYIRGCNTNDLDKSGFAEASRAAAESDFVVLALGEDGWMSGEASSRSSIDLPGVQNELAEEIVKTGKPLAVVLFNGRPLAISRLHQAVPAILEAWFGGTQAGHGIADILAGDYNPSGKLTMTFPQNVGQVPLFYNAKNTGRPFNPANSNDKYKSRYLDVSNAPLYPFGHGLSYTRFDFTDLKTILRDDKILISLNVTNDGNMDGEEVVQLYVRDKVGTITRPLKELKGFQKIKLKKGEKREITFQLTRDDLGFYHPDLTKYFEPGEFTVMAGPDSEKTIATDIFIP
jgi:beta-glucosidase